MDPQVGQLIANKYRLVRLIGDGGMGSVYEATHELLGTTVALKFLHGVLARRKGLKDRFMQEAQVSARIKSIHVVNVSDVDETPEGLAYMVMEYVEGQTLQTLYEENYRARKQLSYAEAFDIMLQILDGVSAAHDLGIVHRDLKPDNVMLTSDTRGNVLVKVLDFGIAKLKASGEMDRGLTRPGVVMGTPEYMAPEQAFSADRVDVRADIFSLGVMFFEMLAGRRPVGGDNAHAIAAQYLEGQISQLTDLAPSVDAELAAAVHRAMGSKPDDRFGSVDAFRNAIEPFSPGGGAVGRTPAFAATMQAEDRTSAVPKTIPPEETFAPPSPADHSGPHPVGDAPDDAAMAALAAAADGPLRDGTVPMPEGLGTAGPGEQAASQELRAGTEAMSPPGPAGPGGATMVGEAFTPPPVPADASGGFEAYAPAPAPMAPPQPRGRGGKKKGAGIFSILLIASAVAAATVGGVYLFNETRSSTEGEDEHVPIDIGNDDGGEVDTPDPEPSDPEPTTTDTYEPPPPPVPPPPTQPPPRPTQRPPKPTQPPPKPTNTTPPPKPTQPPSIIPTVIPSVLPTIPFPIPGQPPPPTQPNTPPPPQPTGLPFPKVQRKRGG